MRFLCLWIVAFASFFVLQLVDVLAQGSRVGSCIQTEVAEILIPAGQTISVPVRITTVGKGSVNYEIDSFSESKWKELGLAVTVRPGRGYLSEERPDVLFVDIFAAVHAVAGTRKLLLPISADGTGSCKATKGELVIPLTVNSVNSIDVTELSESKKRLEKHGWQKYTILEYLVALNREKPNGYNLVRSDQIPALVLLRDPRYLEKITEKLYIDSKGNYSEFGTFAISDKAEKMKYVATFFIQGGMELAIDASSDGIADIVIGTLFAPQWGLGRIWVQVNEFGDYLTKCVAGGEDITDGLITDIGAAASTNGAGNSNGKGSCPDPNTLASNQSGAGFLGRLVGPVGPPRCDFGADRFPFADGGEGNGNGDNGRDIGDPPGSASSDDDFDDLINDIIDDASEALAGSDPTQGSLPGETQPGPDLHLDLPSSDEQSSPLDEIGEKLKGGIPVGNGDPPIHIVPGKEGKGIGASIGLRVGGQPPDDDDLQKRGLLPPSSRGGLFMPPVGPAGQPQMPFTDPRCRGMSVDADRGTLWSNPHYCNGGNYLECLRRSDDSVIDATGGHCRSEVGPNDAVTLACADNTFTVPDCNPLDGNPDERCEDCFPGAPYCETPNEGSPISYSTNSVGGIMQVICHADCPDEPW